MITKDNISVVVNGNPYLVPRSHKLAPKIIGALSTNVPDSELIVLLDEAIAVREYLSVSGRVEIVNGQVLFDGETVQSSLTERIIEFMREKLPVEPLLKFFENLMRNPSFNSRKQLYSFMEHTNLTIDNDGWVVGYKAVQNDYTDKHTGCIDNRPGYPIPRMKRPEVDDNPQNHCSYGYHVGDLSYASGFASGYGDVGGDRMLCVRFNPVDVVSVPEDCNCRKVRVTCYEVLSEFTGTIEAPKCPLFGYTPDPDDGDVDDGLPTQEEAADEAVGALLDQGFEVEQVTDDNGDILIKVTPN